jgi:membrane carboxypeptidase/penicillin-binding protein
VDVPRSGLARPLRQAATQLGVRRLRLASGPVTTSGGSTVARFTATADLASGHTWAYAGRLRLVRQDHRWWVSWSPAAIYPALRAGERFVLSAAWPQRAQVLAADETMLSSPQVVAESGSLQLLTGGVVTATAAQAKALGAPYQAGDQIGQGDMRYQLAASQAVRSTKTTKPIDMVVIQPSTGKVLAVVERPGGFDRALLGEFPPGSTFKVVTASALARTGMRPSTAVQCPSQVDIGGGIFHNDENEQFGATNLQTAFAVSCNSTFAMLAAQYLDGAALASMAAAIEHGSRLPPQLVTIPAPGPQARPHAISPAILDTLRPMMRAVVTTGTAAGVGFPPGVYGKTGTAQYGNGPNPPAHGWFIGYRGDVAFAVLVEGGGLGADSAGPIANAFLRNL